MINKKYKAEVHVDRGKALKQHESNIASYDIFSDPEFKADRKRDQIEYENHNNK